jgi:predicted kinase
MKVKWVVFLILGIQIFIAQDLRAVGEEKVLFASSEQKKTLDQSLKEVLSSYVREWKYIDTENSFPLMIMFSGTPGMGKSYISDQIQEHYKALIIKSDQVRRVLRFQGLSSEEKVGNQGRVIDIFYFGYLFPWIKKNAKNRLIVLDSSIDRKFMNLKGYFEKEKIPFIVIRLKSSLEEAKKKVKERESDYERYFRFFDSWMCDYEAFDKKNVDLVIETTGNLDHVNLEPLYSMIDNKLVTISKL